MLTRDLHFCSHSIWDLFSNESVSPNSAHGSSSKERQTLNCCMLLLSCTVMQFSASLYSTCSLHAARNKAAKHHAVSKDLSLQNCTRG